MICFYNGTPGSGKTYESILVIIDALKRKRHVYHNIDGLGEGKTVPVVAGKTGLLVSEVPDYLHKMTTEQVKTIFEWAPDGCLIVVDETQKYFNAKDYRNTENRKLSDWGDEHRHKGIDVLFLTPRISKVESGVRALAEWTYLFRKLNMLGSVGNGRYRCRIYPEEDTTGPFQSQFIKKYDKTIFACYKSYFAEGTKESKFVGGANILKHPVFFAIPVVVGFAIFMIARSPMAHGDLLGAKELAEKAKIGGVVTAEKTPGQDSSPATTSPPAAPPGSAGGGQGGVSSADPPALVVLGYINGRPVYRHSSGRVILDPSLPRIAPTGADAI